MDNVPMFRWRLRPDGGGELQVEQVTGSKLEVGTRLFDSLVQLPDGIAEKIREDGREQGEWPRSVGARG